MRRALAFACATSVLFLSTSGWTQPVEPLPEPQPVDDVADEAGGAASPSVEDNMDRARELAIGAKKLIGEGNCEQALPMAQEAESLFHAPIHLYMIGQCLEEAGELTQALETYEDLVAEELPAGASSVFREAQEKGRSRITVLSGRIPSLIVSTNPADAQLTLDGEPFEPGARAQRMDPGTYQLRATAEGYEPQDKEITLAEGQGVVRTSLRLNAINGGGREDGGDAGGGPFPPIGVPAIIAYGVGGVGLVAGSIFGLVALNKAGELEDRCENQVCDVSEQDTFDTAESFGTISTIGFIVAGIGAAAGTVLWLTGVGSPAKSTGVDMRFTPIATPTFPGASPAFGTGAGLGVEGRF